MSPDGAGMAIVILGAAVWPGGVPSPTLARRISRGAAAAQRFPKAIVIGSGGLGLEPPAEADAIRDRLMALGVAASRIHCEDRSTSTLENALFCRQILSDLGLKHVLIVTDSYHCPRALMTFRWLGLQSRVAPVWHIGRMDRWLWAVLREIAAFPVYLLKLSHHKRRGETSSSSG